MVIPGVLHPETVPFLDTALGDLILGLVRALMPGFQQPVNSGLH